MADAVTTTTEATETTDTRPADSSAVPAASAEAPVSSRAEQTTLEVMGKGSSSPLRDDTGSATTGGKAPERPVEPDAVPDYGTLKLPEGYDAKDPAFTEATKLFAAAKLPADIAQKLVDHVIARDRAAGERNAKAWGDTIATWQSELKASLSNSSEFTGAATGGDRLREVQALAAKAITAYGGEDAAAITQHMKTYALGDFGPLARFMARVGRTVAEDVPVRPSGAAAGPRTAQQIYSNSNMNE
jgi:hypothetical protein